MAHDRFAWQERALSSYKISQKKFFLLSVCPGGGKTLGSAKLANFDFAEKHIDFAVVVTPTLPIKAGFLRQWHRAGINLTTNLKDSKGRPKEFTAAAITYQQLKNIVSTFETWVANGVKLLVIFDEIHHAAEDNDWGYHSEKLASIATKVISMTGTPFRNDGSKISFLNYDANGKVSADFTYTLEDAIANRVCRDVDFIHDDGFADFIHMEQQQHLKISEAKTPEERSNIARSIFDKDGVWIKSLLEKAEGKLDSERTSDRDAACLVVCRPGWDKDENKFLHGMSQLVRCATNEHPTMIEYDDPEAPTKIEIFRKGTEKFILAVRMISEGVDIPRIKIILLACQCGSELLFRQIIGRALRVDDEKNPGHATIFMPKFPQLVEWAQRIKDEAVSGLRKRKVLDAERETGEPSPYTNLGSTHEDGGGSDAWGNRYTPNEINAAETVKAASPSLWDVSVLKVALILRQAGFQSEDAEAPEEEPLQTRKKRLRLQIHKAVNQFVYSKNPSPEAVSSLIKGIWIKIFNQMGVRDMDDLMDNHSVDEAKNVLILLNKWMIHSV